MEAGHYWMFVVKSGGMMGSSFVFVKLYIIMLPADILKSYHSSFMTEFMWSINNCRSILQHPRTLVHIV